MSVTADLPYTISLGLGMVLDGGTSRILIKVGYSKAKLR